MLESVKTLLVDGIQDGELNTVLNRLESLGVHEIDDYMIAYAMNSEFTHIQNECHVVSIPDGLRYVYTDMCVAVYLNSLYRIGKLNIDDLDLSGAVKQITEGDVSITFDETATTTQKFTTFIDILMNGRRGELLRFRKLNW